VHRLGVAVTDVDRTIVRIPHMASENFQHGVSPILGENRPDAAPAQEHALYMVKVRGPVRVPSRWADAMPRNPRDFHHFQSVPPPLGRVSENFVSGVPTK
jgi:hypothetical protein